MKINVISQLLEDLYYQGRVTSDKKLDSRDFEQLVVLARGEAIRAAFERGVRMYGYTSMMEGGELLQHYITPITKKVENGIVDISGVMALPLGLGLYNIINTNKECGDELYFMRIGTGAGWQVNCSDLTENEIYYENLGNRVRLYNAPECLNEVDVLVIEDEGLDNDVPTDVGFSILKMCFDIATKTNSFIVDSLDDYSSTDDQKRNLLAQFQANDSKANRTP